MPQTLPQSEILTIGDLPFDPSVPASARPRIGTVFLRTPGLVTRTPLHATQRLAWTDALNEARLANGEGPLTEAEIEAEWAHSVDLLFNEAGHVLIRPDPAAMPLAFLADELLQQRLNVSKRLIRFLNVANERIRSALRARGEYWRMSVVPLQQEEILAHIGASRVAIDGLPIYYYNQVTGTRFVTLQEFEGLQTQPDHVLRKMLIEIKTFCARRNRLGNPEIDFFLSPPAFGHHFDHVQFVDLDTADLRQKHAALAAAFREAVPTTLCEDNPAQIEWRNQMMLALMSRPHETDAKEIVQGLSPEFFLQIEWLPGARIEEGELLMDPIFTDADAAPQDAGLQNMCDRRAREFIFNYVREFGDIEYVNIGRIGRSMSLRRDKTHRNAVYIAEVKQTDNPVPVVRIIRIQKWGIAEHLNDAEDLLTAILRAEDYTDYILDRRLGCRQLGMHLPPHVQTRRISERYTGQNSRYHGQVYWTTYLERDYVAGRASDKLPEASYRNPEFNCRLANLLGEAAAINLIVGRMQNNTTIVLFDDGDEVVLLGSDGLPASVVVSDHTGTFTNYEGDLMQDTPAYAMPVNRRASKMPNVAEFAEIYLAAFVRRFERIQQVYRERQRAFDSLFKHRPWDPGGSMAYRWFHILKRLDASDPRQLAEAIRRHIKLP